MRALSPLCLFGIALGALSTSILAQEASPPDLESTIPAVAFPPRVNSSNQRSSDIVPAAYEREDYTPRLFTRFDDGFVVYTEDDEFEFRIKLMEQTDAKLFIPEDQQPARPGLYIPRFRLYFKGHITQSYEYELSMVDAGWNWYPNRYVKFYFDWQASLYDSPVPITPAGRHVRDSHTLWARAQVFF